MVVKGLKIGGPVQSVETRQVVAVANVCGVKLNHIHTKEGDEKKREFLAFSPFGLYPVLDVPKGVVVGATAIAIYLAQQNLAANLLTGEAHQLSQCISTMQTCERAMQNDQTGYLAYLEVLLNTRTFLCGERLSVADIAIAIAISSVQDRHNMPQNVDRWLRTVMSDPRVAKANKTQAAQSPRRVATPNKKADAVQDAAPEKKAEAAAPAEITTTAAPAESAAASAPAEAMPPAAPAGPIKLPPTSFDIESYKRAYSNSEDCVKEVENLFKIVDREQFNFYRVKYDKQEGECEADFMTSNLLGGFIQSLSNEARKYGMGVFHVVGEDGDFNYEGVLLLRSGENKMSFVEEHRSFEYHFWEELDIDNEEHKNYIIKCFSADSGDMLDGKTIRDCKVFK